ncbi:kazal-type serine protease inhibitor domain-containing protein 1-like [Chanos chanos]|uniref:Kazal-type serine protease inhibitor domain-containing protein 1-like n=1 Tax=Chanos chanos TaxID=29144 RepID=A0A6J2WHU5_CHACN|nr:kazal-type serine protease inhibitor domain-containing protein 1-like [Chanos chanos]
MCAGLPPQHHGWMRLWQEGESCGDCETERCPLAPPGCPAGRVRDRCDCCEQCGNAEGQPCDPDGAQDFYGRCGEGLYCKTIPRRKCPKGQFQADPEPRCVSPRITRAPRDLINYTGNDIVFGCEVTSYPLPILSWRKKGSDNFLPGDDPHISVQARGGPQPYTISTWIQIHGLHLSDAGIYTCTSHNALGEASASARLIVLRDAKEGVTGCHLSEGDDYYDSSGEQ